MCHKKACRFIDVFFTLTRAQYTSSSAAPEVAMPKQMMNQRNSRKTFASLRNPADGWRSKLVYCALFATFGCLMVINWISLT
ncbi:hypothetical protein ATO7_07992 [Oceanococcus atlanticus]|uniref:Uncharacterized protein n=1 Tax=Oceanococcus atlanticus TaxID=1317117 RepID=A0A1Y1SE40_9GAMM|nr:hypothetical protein ATO7_07992 [Oceanococcus atlanticus]